MWDGKGYLNDIEMAETEVQRYADAGGSTLVDLTSGGLTENDQDLLFDSELNHLKHAEAVRARSGKDGAQRNPRMRLVQGVPTTSSDCGE